MRCCKLNYNTTYVCSRRRSARTNVCAFAASTGWYKMQRQYCDYHLHQTPSNSILTKAKFSYSETFDSLSLSRIYLFISGNRTKVMGWNKKMRWKSIHAQSTKNEPPELPSPGFPLSAHTFSKFQII